MNVLELSEQEIIRRGSLDRLREMHIDPYPAAEYTVDGYADEILKTALLDGQVKNGLAMIPGVGQVGTFVYNRFNGKTYGSRLGGAPALSVAESALLAPWSVAKAAEPDANYRQKRKGVYDTATLISMTLGLPVRGVLKDGEQIDGWSGLDMFSEEQN